MNEKLARDFQPVFFPRSVAVVGASKNETKFGTRYLAALLDAGFHGKVYAVHPSGGTVLGVEAYPSLQAIPEPVDYVIVSVPYQHILTVVEDCAAKGVKAVQMFTAGFRETGTPEGRALEDAVAKRAREAGFRVIGPNCIGVYNPSIRMPYGMSPQVGKAGSVGIISQSGGVCSKVVKAGLLRGIHFSKVVSFGNGCDLDSPDYLEYLSEDPETRIIGGYLEGVRDMGRLVALLRKICPRKPVVLWKGGRTAPGAETAASHTGSLSTPDALWVSLSRQFGFVKVCDVDELTDALLILQHLRRSPGRKAAIVSGIMGGGGGDSVSATDTSAALGLEVLPFAPETRRRIQPLLPPAGCILRNPLDLGSVGPNVPALEKTLELVAADANVELIIVQQPLDDLISFLGKEAVDRINDVFIRFAQEGPKPVLVVSQPGAPSEGQWEMEQRLLEASIPVFPTLERAAKAVVNVDQFFRVHKDHAV